MLVTTLQLVHGQGETQTQLQNPNATIHSLLQIVGMHGCTDQCWGVVGTWYNERETFFEEKGLHLQLQVLFTVRIRVLGYTEEFSKVVFGSYLKAGNSIEDPSLVLGD